MFETIDDLPQSVRDRYSDEELELWLSTYNRVLSETDDPIKAETAAEGMVKRFEMRLPVKMLANGNPVIGGWGIMFGTPVVKDRVETFFDNNTEFLVEYYRNAPLWYYHENGRSVIGQRHALEIFPGHGIWVEHELFVKSRPTNIKTFRAVAAAEFDVVTPPSMNLIVRQVESGEIFYSSDSIGHYAFEEIDFDSGRIGLWPLAGFSLIPNNDEAEPGLGPVRFLSPSRSVNPTAGDGGDSSGQSDDGNDPEAQTAQVVGDEVQTAQSHDNGDPAMLSRKSFSTGARTMNLQELLSALATVFGLDNPETATIEDVQPIMADFMAQLTTPEGEGEDEPDDAVAFEFDPAQLRATLGLEDDASNEDVAEALQPIMEALQPEPEPEPVAAMSVVVNGLGDAARLAQRMAVRPVDQGIPNLTRRSNRSGRYGGVNYNRTPEPGIMTLFRYAHPDYRAVAKKELTPQLGPNGGYMMPQVMFSNYLPVLRDKLPLIQLGVQEFVADGDVPITIPKDKTEEEAYWVTDGQDTPESDETTGGIILRPKPIAVRVTIANSMLANASVNNESRIREKSSYRLARGIQYAALYGTGGVSGSNVGTQPMGLKTMGGHADRSVTLTTLGSANGAKPKPTDLTDAQLRVAAANVEIDDSIGWIMAPRTVDFFNNLTDANGNYLLRGSMREGPTPRIFGADIESTNMVPINLTVGSSTDCTDIFYGVWMHMLLAMSNAIEVIADPYTKSGRLQTVFTIYTYADVEVEYDEAFEVISGVRP